MPMGGVREIKKLYFEFHLLCSNEVNKIYAYSIYVYSIIFWYVLVKIAINRFIKIITVIKINEVMTTV